VEYIKPQNTQSACITREKETTTKRKRKKREKKEQRRRAAPLRPSSISAAIKDNIQSFHVNDISISGTKSFQSFFFLSIIIIFIQ
jgi:polynucleotide 5'-kinase involved in rRNA processing